MYHMNTDSQFQEAIDALETKRVRYVLCDSVVSGANLTTWFPGYEHPPASELKMEQ